MQALFESLNHALAGSMSMALLAAFAWGIASILLSPCHLASIPLVVAFVNGQGQVTTRRAFALSTLFSLGILITIAMLGVITVGAGRIAGDVGGWAYYAVAVIFFAVGLHLLDVIPMPWSGPSNIALKRKGMLAALLLGLIFGIALGPCTFAYMAPVLGLTFKVAAGQPIFAASLLLSYGIGHCLLIVAVGSASSLVQRYLDWNEKSKALLWLRRLCGVLVLGGGLWLIYSAPTG
jgi:cytochrome c-type biogenesis protein